MPDPEPDIALREWAPFVYSPLIKRSFLKEVAFEECFGTVKGLNGRILSPRLVVPSALHPAPQPPVLHEEAAVQRRDRARSGHLDHTPSLIPSPVLLPHMTPSSVQLRKPPSRSPCCQIFTEARFSPSPHRILPTPAETRAASVPTLAPLRCWPQTAKPHTTAVPLCCYSFTQQTCTAFVPLCLSS